MSNHNLSEFLTMGSDGSNDSTTMEERRQMSFDASDSNDLTTMQVYNETHNDYADSNKLTTTQVLPEIPKDYDDLVELITIQKNQEMSVNSADSNDSTQKLTSKESQETEFNSITRKYQDFYEEFFDLYRNLPELWNPKHKKFRKRRFRTKAYQKLTTKLNEKYEESSLKFTMLKINSWKHRYRVEAKKTKELFQRGVKYEPGLWWYKKLSFLESVLSLEVKKMRNNKKNKPSVISTNLGKQVIVTDKIYFFLSK